MCASPNVECHVYAGGGISTALTMFYLAYAFLLIIPGSLIMGLILKKSRAKR